MLFCNFGKVYRNLGKNPATNCFKITLEGPATGTTLPGVAKHSAHVGTISEGTTEFSSLEMFPFGGFARILF